LKFLGNISNYFDSEWSYAKFKVPNEDNSLFQTTCGFNLEGTHLIVITSAGNYYLAQIPKTKGACKIVETKSLL
jgi:hypothetical protein